jgi:precorrin-6Y C5,15-methyltransferase (decarboxylating)
MVTIIGNGMGEYDFSNINLDLNQYETIVCDKNFKEEGSNILKFSYKEAKEYLIQNAAIQNILYVVTGSPLFFSAATILAKQLPKEQVRLIDNTSCKSYLLCAAMIDENDVNVVSLHGKYSIDLTQFLNKKYTFVVCDDKTIKRLQEALFYFKEEDIETTIGYKLGYKDERIEAINLFDMPNSYDLTQPYVLLLERKFALNSGVNDDIEFETERGMITKKYKRHLSLQNLDLEPNQLLWDIGAGSGSCGIEAFNRYKVRTILFEKNEIRVDFIKNNLSNHHMVDTVLHIGEACDFFSVCEQNPQRIFVGGGGEKVIAQLPYLYERLDDNGILLINAITLKHLSQMINVLNENEISYETHSISLTTYKGKLDLVEPERQLFQIKVYKKESK